MNSPRDRVISVVLSNDEWQAFMRLQPQPVAWIRQRIAEAIATSAKSSPADEAYRTSAKSH